ncbi:unnamed protein product [Dovyalis caffra]|uniref:UvrD-like helicase ATP-binding domain-containing protein n=1 Tax=Dovyalis caffra TaxID=77055 RepID=A0AAV1R3A7_9ROSI|nr:unnamed protein product [Dovyalis caffra]
MDPLRVFTEIMAHIKGGLRTWESCNGRLSQEGYLELSGRMSTLGIQEKETVYKIFKAYEKMKVKNGDFDMADLVIDLHDRLKKEKYDGDMMDYVYIDEVQDLTMSQIALFKFICKNVIEGFVFSGDTAQTIAKGVDFRSGENDRRNKKGQLSKILQLSQNFRTHAGVLKLAQSVLDLLYHFFPSLVDILSHETSLISGEAPVFLAENSEKAIATIFRSNADEKCNFVGFGAEQVILVRDDHTRNKIYSYVGKQALVLTILECKGLEFQDVFLYNFFGSPDLRDKWGIVYEYMKEHGIPCSSSSRSFGISSFDLAKHYLLCSELKQLYVAITRTRQRLWICDEDFSNPMFDYWRKKELVKVRQLDDSLLQEMQVVSSLEEWKSRGYKLLHEHNYDMAITCFERAGDRHAQTLAEALGLKAAADRMHGSNPIMASNAHMQAAEMFESIGKVESAAECFYLSNNYERAGRIYSQCGESSVKRAAECFYLAGCYMLAAELYARGNHFSMCLTACTKGELFEMGLKYIQGWKQQLLTNDYRDRIAQEFLESSALHYHKLGEKIKMMRYVRSYDSMDSIRKYLKKFGYLDELLSLEVGSGNFLKAANIANIKGELLLEADLLEKAGHFKDASILVLWYVLLNSLWPSGNRGWPLKHFAEKEKLLSKAKSLAKNASSQHCEIVSIEAEILLNEQSSLSMMKKHLSNSQRHKSIRGEILSARKILDEYLDLNVSKYWQQNNLVHHQPGFWKEKSSENRVSVETLVFYWKVWKNMIFNIFKYLSCLPAQDTSKYRSYGEFCFSYLDLWKQINTNVYLLLKSDANWVRVLESRFVRESKLVSVNVHQVVFAARSYWRSELLSVGMNVLIKLKELYESTYSLSLFSQSICLVHFYEVAKSLLSSRYLNHQSHDNKILQNLIGIPTQHFFSCIFPVDWRESLEVNTISWRMSPISKDLLKEVIFVSVSLKNKLSYEQLGRMAVIILGSGHMYKESYEKIKDRVAWNPTWMAFFEAFCRNACELSYMWKLHGALADVYIANWRKEDYISPGCFLYLIERQLISLSCSQGYFLTTMSSFIEWFIYQERSDSLASVAEHAPQSTEAILEFVAHVVKQFLHNMKHTMEWTEKSYKNVKDCEAVVLRLVVAICLIYLNFGLC